MSVPRETFSTSNERRAGHIRTCELFDAAASQRSSGVSTILKQWTRGNQTTRDFLQHNVTEL
jgi:hypothetical protein